MIIFWETHKLHWVFYFILLFINLFFHSNNFYFYFYFLFVPNFDMKVLQVCGIIMGHGSWESIQSHLVGHQVQLLISFGGISLLSMEDCALSVFLESWTLVVSYFRYRFRIFDRPLLKEYVFQIEGSPHLFQSCLHVVQDNFLPIATKINPSFESLVVTNTPCL